MTPDPATHKCALENIDYSQAMLGTITCRTDRGGCGRRWEAVTGRGWVPIPSPVGAPRRTWFQDA